MARKKNNPDAPPLEDAIMESAMYLFGTRGFEATSIKEIGQRAGISSAALYYHYKNKQDILFKGLHAAVRELMEACEPAVVMTEFDPPGALRLFAQQHTEFQLSDRQGIQPTYAALMYNMRQRESVISAEQRAKLEIYERQHLNNLRKILSAGDQLGVFKVPSITEAAFAIIGVLEHSIYWFQPDGKKQRKQLGKTFGDIALRIAGYEDIA